MLQEIGALIIKGVLDLLNSKANSSDVNIKTEITDALFKKADKLTTYSKTEVNDALALKANILDVNTKTEMTTALALKAPIAKPVLTGTVAINTPASTNIDSALVVPGTMNVQPKTPGVHFGTTGYDQ